jgi:hypothetical protein
VFDQSHPSQHHFTWFFIKSVDNAKKHDPFVLCEGTYLYSSGSCQAYFNKERFNTLNCIVGSFIRLLTKESRTIPLSCESKLPLCVEEKHMQWFHKAYPSFDSIKLFACGNCSEKINLVKEEEKPIYALARKKPKKIGFIESCDYCGSKLSQSYKMTQPCRKRELFVWEGQWYYST